MTLDINISEDDPYTLKVKGYIVPAQSTWSYDLKDLYNKLLKKGIPEENVKKMIEELAHEIIDEIEKGLDYE